VRRLHRWPLGLLGAVAGCDSAGFLGPACQPGLVVAVTDSPQPAFTWTPECEVGTVYVTTDVGNAMWTISSVPESDLTPTNRIASGVLYGVLPAEAEQFGDLKPLEAEHQYHVFLGVTDTQGRSTQVGEAAFTIPSE